MRGQQFPISTWLIHPPSPANVYLDAQIWREFVDWVRPASDTDVQRLENLVQKRWRVHVFRDQLNRCFGRDHRRDTALNDIGIEIINARGNGRVTDRDELFISEAMQVYFASENPQIARRQAEFLLLVRRHSPDIQVTLVTQHRNFWRVPNVNTFYLDNLPLRGETDLPATFDFLSDFDIHSAIEGPIRDRIMGNDYGHIMLDALIGFRDHVRQRSGLLAVDGRELMEQAFGSDDPRIMLNPLIERNRRSSQMNEQRGYKELACGVMTGLRNPLVHVHEGATGAFAARRYPDRKTLFKYLSFLSLLCERSDGPLP